MRFRRMVLERTMREISYSDESTASYSGQTDMTLRASLPSGEEVGRVDYTIYGREVSVRMVEVSPRFRRRGIATELMTRLQKKYPRTEIVLGMATPDGKKLVDSLEGVLYVDRAKRRKVDSLRREIAELEAEEERLRVRLSKEGASDAISAAFNKLYDRQHEAEEELWELTR